MSTLDENPLGRKSPWTKSPWTNVPLDQCPFGHMSLGQMYSGYCLTIASCDKSLLGLKSPFDNSYLGQMYPGYHLTTASLDPKSPLRIVTLDNCIWTKVSSDKCLLGQLSHLIIASLGNSPPWTTVSLINNFLRRKHLDNCPYWQSSRTYQIF